MLNLFQTHCHSRVSIVIPASLLSFPRRRESIQMDPRLLGDDILQSNDNERQYQSRSYYCNGDDYVNDNSKLNHARGQGITAERFNTGFGNFSKVEKSKDERCQNDNCSNNILKNSEWLFDRCN